MMRIKRVLSWLLALLTVALVSQELSAQHYQPFGPVDYTPPLQPFAPVNDYLLEHHPKPNEGYFFSYERLIWSASKPDITPIGAQIGAVTATIPSTTALFLALDQNTVTTAQLGGSLNIPQVNTINSAVPQTEWGWGNRIELGYMVDNEGWVVSVLSKVKDHFSAIYGADAQRLNMLSVGQGLNGIDGILFNDPLAPRLANPPDPPGLAPIAATPGTAAIPAFDGFRQVSVVFLDPFGLLNGFVDLDLDTFPDDLNFDGVFGNAGVDTTGDGLPDTPAPIDFGDAVRLATIFDSLEVVDRTHIDGVELMKMNRLRPTHHQSIIELFYGVRYLEIDNRFSVIGRGGVLADSEWENRSRNRIVGPQVGFRHYNRRRRWTFAIEGRFLAGANFVSINQDGVLGNLIVPGQVDNPFAMGPTTFVNKLTTEKFAPVGELRVETALQLTRAVSIQVGWNGLVTGNVAKASNTILYQLPTMGIVDREEDLFLQGLSFGVEINR